MMWYWYALIIYVMGLPIAFVGISKANAYMRDEREAFNDTVGQTFFWFLVIPVYLAFCLANVVGEQLAKIHTKLRTPRVVEDMLKKGPKL